MRVSQSKWVKQHRSGRGRGHGRAAATPKTLPPGNKRAGHIHRGKYPFLAMPGENPSRLELFSQRGWAIEGNTTARSGGEAAPHSQKWKTHAEPAEHSRPLFPLAGRVGRVAPPPRLRCTLVLAAGGGAGTLQRPFSVSRCCWLGFCSSSNGMRTSCMKKTKLTRAEVVDNKSHRDRQREATSHQI